MFQVGRDLRRSLVQPAAHKRSVWGWIWVAQDFILSGFEKLQVWRETTYLLWAACSTAWASPLEKSFYQSKPLVSSYAHYVLSLHHAPLWRAWLHLPIGFGVCCLGDLTLNPFLLKSEQTRLPQPFLRQHVLQPPAHLGDPLLNLLQCIDIFLI